jgi:hypothetical protein
VILPNCGLTKSRRFGGRTRKHTDAAIAGAISMRMPWPLTETFVSTAISTSKINQKGEN